MDSTGTKKFCEKCGKEITANVLFCSECGATIETSTVSNTNHSHPSAPQSFIPPPMYTAPIQKKKKSILKKWWFWLIMVLLLFVIIAATKDNTGNSQASGSTTATSAVTDSAGLSNNENTTAQKEQSDKRLTLSKYSQIQNGMTEEEVFEIIGFVGTPEAEVGEKGSAYYTVSYRYMGSSQVKGSLGANASFMFQGGKLNMKSQIGLSD